MKKVLLLLSLITSIAIVVYANVNPTKYFSPVLLIAGIGSFIFYSFKIIKLISK